MSQRSIALKTFFLIKFGWEDNSFTNGKGDTSCFIDNINTFVRIYTKKPEINRKLLSTFTTGFWE